MPRHINMRRHLHALIWGDRYNIGFGHWIMYRELDKSVRSRYWNELKQESIGGPAYEYRDFLLKTWRYKQNISSGSSETSALTPLTEGLFDPNSVLYYIEIQDVTYMNSDNIRVSRPLNVKVGDTIYEISQQSGKNRPDLPLTVRKKMLITDVETVLGDYGRDEYHICFCKDSPLEY